MEFPSARNCVGVTPVALRKVRVKALWSQKPQASADVGDGLIRHAQQARGGGDAGLGDELGSA